MDKNENNAADLLTSLKDVTRILDVVRYTAGLGKGQLERLERAKAVIAKHEKR